MLRVCCLSMFMRMHSYESSIGLGFGYVSVSDIGFVFPAFGGINENESRQTIRNRKQNLS